MARIQISDREEWKNMKERKYNHLKTEEKWLEFWQSLNLFANTQLESIKRDNKEYLLFAFAYPSGSGLHVGHVESKTALDILARFRRMQGRDVFFPVGWDAFGLPAENYAIKTGVHPAITTKEAINTFRRQVKRLGISYDWSKELATNHPEYYRWTQWIFLQLFRKGLAYQKEGKVNWCPSCQTVLANEQVVNGKCERCGTDVVQKDLKQWYFQITKYQDELIDGLETVDWPEPTKLQQLHWIGRSFGAEVDFPLLAEGKKSPTNLTVFTTRLDTIFGATFLVISPEKFLELKLDQELEKRVTRGELTGELQEQVQKYLDDSFKKTEEARKIGEKEKTGQDTGLQVENPFTGESLPLYVADYVLSGYGTGVIMAVPAHDERDFAFAKKFSLAIKAVVRDPAIPDEEWQQVASGESCLAAHGFLVNSGKYTKLSTEDAIAAMLQDHPEFARKTVNYKLRDWLISRQRYWGAPIPIVYDPEGQPHPVKEEHLPWLLPEDVDFKPTGESPLRSSKEFKARVEKLYGKGWTPEYDTMDTFVDSSWYYLRYVDARNKEAFVRKELADTLLPVDLYLIGPEHIVLHLLYSRFFTKFLRDEGYLNFDEPFAKMRHQGMILGPNGKKMSKSKGNVINPDEIIQQYGADTLRVYEMFMGPLEADKPWDTRAVAGVARFLQKVYRLAEEELEKYEQLLTHDQKANFVSTQVDLQRKLHQSLQKVTQDIADLKYNTAIASLMELSNLWEKNKDEKNLLWTLNDVLSFIKMLAPFAPFMSEELYDRFKNTVAQADVPASALAGKTETADTQDRWAEHFHNCQSVHLENWPQYDPKLAAEEESTLVVQINGKVRAQFSWPTASLNDREAILAHALALEGLKRWLPVTPSKSIYVPGKLVSFVVSEN